MITPIFNHVLIEIVDDYDGVIGSDKVANVQKGILRAYGLMSDHLTASTGFEINNIDDYRDMLENSCNKIVYWQEYADSGSKFTIESKEYVIIPFYRLMGIEG